MKNFKEIFLLFFIFSTFILAYPVKAVTSLSDVTLAIDPKNASSLATWTISFTLPESANVGHILISLAGYQPDLGSAELFVSGLPLGIPQVGKTNPNCVSNCDDIRYYYKEPIKTNKNTKITFTLKNVKNPEQPVKTGINFIYIFSSKYPQTTLVFKSSEQLVELSPALNDSEEILIPETATSEPESVKTQAVIQNVLLNELFYKEGAKTTRLDKIKDAAKVEDFTLDLRDKVKVSFKGTINLSKPEAVFFIKNLSAYMTFDHLYFKVSKELMDYFKVPLALTFYDVPFVWVPDILKDDKEILVKEKVENFHESIIDGQNQISFVINEAGGYKLIPHFELYITDNQEIKKESNLATFSGRISDPKAIIKIVFNGKEQKEKPKADSLRGEFSFSVELEEGPNLIEAEAESQYGEIGIITKIVQYLPQNLSQVQEKEGINPFNLIAIGLAVLVIILMFLVRYLEKKQKR